MGEWTRPEAVITESLSESTSTTLPAPPDLAPTTTFPAASGRNETAAPAEVDERPETFLPETYPGSAELFELEPQFDLLGYLLDGAPETSEIWTSTVQLGVTSTHLWATIDDTDDLAHAELLAASQLRPETVFPNDSYIAVEAIIYVDDEKGWAIGFSDRGVHFQAVNTRGDPDALAVLIGI